MKRCLVFKFLVALLLTLSACNWEESVFRVAVVLPGETDDLGMNQSVHEALQKIQNEQGEAQFQFVMTTGVSPTEATAVMRQAAESGVDLIIAHGDEYGTAVQQAAAAFPQVSFAWGLTEAALAAENVFMYRVRAAEAGYMNGLLAATLAGTGAIGLVEETTAVSSDYAAGFRAGAQAAVEEVVVHAAQVDGTNGRTVVDTVQAWLNDEIVVISGTRIDANTLALIEQQNGVWLGVHVDQRDLAADAVLISQVYDWSVVYDDVIGQIKQGTLGGESYALGFDNSGILARYNRQAPAVIRQIGDEALFGISEGLIDPGS